MEMTTVRIPKDEYDRARRLAERQGTTAAAYLRRALADANQRALLDEALAVEAAAEAADSDWDSFAIDSAFGGPKQ